MNIPQPNVERELDSTLIYVPKDAIKILDYLVGNVSNANSQKIFQTIKNLSLVSTDNFVSIKELMNTIQLSQNVFRNRIKQLKNKKILITHSGRAVFERPCHSRLNVLTFSPLTNISDLENVDKDKKSLVNGRSAVKRVSESLSNNDAYVPAQYRDKLKASTQGYAVPIPSNINELVAPSTIITRRRESRVSGRDGTKHLNFAESLYGVVNDYDLQTLDLLYEMTIKYIETLPSHMIDTIDASIRIPVWVEDMLEERGLLDTTENRLSISMSLLRIEATLFKLYQNNPDNPIESISTDDNVNVLFRFLSSLVVMNRSGEKPAFFENKEQINTEEQDILSSLKRDFSTEMPFTCALVQWNPDFFKRICSPNRKTIFAINKQVHKIPATLYAIYTKIRLDSFKNNPSLQFNQHNVINTNLIELVKFVWLNETDETYKRLVKQCIKDIKSISSRLPSIVELTISKKKAGRVTANLFGVKLKINIPRLDNPRLAINCNSEVEMSLDIQQLITDSGARYTPSKINTPTILSPIKNILELAAEAKSKKRRVLPYSAKNLQAKLEHFKVGKYTITFTLNEQDYMLSQYNEYQDLEGFYYNIARNTHSDLSAVEIFFTHHLRSLKMLPNLSYEELQRITNILGVGKKAVLTHLINRVRIISNVIGKDENEIRSILKI